ncbi:diaminopimelate epimerase [Gammaproteobacteria bacterium 45_16_T64]|nr:diaminopimelate epimerase [Gammaproteobacteria bacterium 45_16_T64]
MNISFTKMHGLGNDFMVIDQTSTTIDLTPAHIQFLSDRHLGIGFDQLLVVSLSPSDNVDFRYQIFNADGGEVEQCGNGARCFARFVQERNLTNKPSIVVETNTGIITLNVQDDGQVTVDMGPPVLDPLHIPFNAIEQAITYSVPTSQGDITLAAVSMGNPHGVLVVDNVDSADVEGLGPELEKHAAFPNRANIGFMQIVSRDHIRLRVFERGVGETRACGTGACAAAVAAIQQGLINNQVTVSLPGGDLVIEWHPGTANDTTKSADRVMMTGPATTVYEGTISL